MKKRPYLLLITFSLAFILGNSLCNIPTLPSDYGAYPHDSPYQQESKVRDDGISDPFSKEADPSPISRSQFHECEINPTAGEFEYTKTEIDYNWEDATGGTWNNLSEDAWVAIELPFNFSFYGETFDTVFVSRHGWMSFYNTEPDSTPVWLGSSDERYWYAIAIYAIPISTILGTPGVYNLSLTSPNRVVIEYSDVYYQYYPGEYIGSFQALLYENGTIDFNYAYVQNTESVYYSTGLNHGAIYDNYVEHHFSSFPVTDTSLRFTPPTKWIFITSPSMTDQSDYTLTWVGQSDVAIDMYYVFLDYAFYDNTTLNAVDISGLTSMYWQIEVWMETDAFNYTVSMTLIVDLDEPIISILYPLDDGVNYEAKVNWTAYDPTTHVEYIEIYINGTLYGTEQWSYETSLVVPNLHTYNLTLIAYDLLGNKGNDTVTFFYNRTVPAVVSITCHQQNYPYDLSNYYMDLGWVADRIDDSLAWEGALSTYNRLSCYDAVFIGDYGFGWPSEDIDILNSYLDGGGKLVYFSGSVIPSGLYSVLSNLGISVHHAYVSEPTYTTDFLTEHPLMTGVTELYINAVNTVITPDFPATTLIRSHGGKYVTGAVVDLGLQKVLCLDTAISQSIYEADNAIFYENIVTKWVGVEEHDLRAGLSTPAALGSGHQVNFTAYALNQGSSVEGSFSLELWIDEVMVDSLLVGSLNPGDWVSLETSYNVTSAGSVNVTAYIAPVLDETVIFNNRETKILDVYYMAISEPSAHQLVRGGAVYINFTATDKMNIVGVTAFVNGEEVYGLSASGSGAYVDGVFVPVFKNGTNVITLVSFWESGANASASVSIESYGVVPIFRPSPGDYADIFVEIPEVGFQMYNLSIDDWVSPLEVNATLYANFTTPPYDSEAFESWIVINVLNGYVSEMGPSLEGVIPPNIQYFLFTCLPAPEPVPYSGFIDFGSRPTAAIGDLTCFMQWNQIFTVTGSGSWNGYATHIAEFSTDYFTMMIEVLQCNGMFVRMVQNHSGMTVTAEVVSTNMLPPSDRAPIINGPEDMVIAEDATGINITWIASGNYPTTYVIYVDGDEVESGSWAPGVPVVHELTSPAVGDHNYTIVFHDDNGMWTMDTVWVSVEDTIAPTIDSPPDMHFEEGTIDLAIVWSPYDSAPLNYTILRNDSVIESDWWDGEQISVSLDGLSAGTYNFTLIVRDVGGHTAADSVIVIVDPAMAPIVSSPGDVTFEVGTTGQSIVWIASDDYPSGYILRRNGTVIEEQNWDGSDIVVSLDGLAVGVYNYTVTVIDVAGHTSSDTVIVTVTEAVTTTTTTTPPTTPEPTLDPMILIAAGIGGVVIIIVIILFVKRK